MAMRQAANDRERIPAGGDDGAAFKHTAQAFDVGGGPVREVADRALTNLAILALALAQEDGRRRVPVGNGFNIHGGVLAQRRIA
jgi:hypothetical protein